eukprot:4865153-Pleurochrysis_carterae.AAC.2
MCACARVRVCESEQRKGWFEAKAGEREQGEKEQERGRVARTGWKREVRPEGVDVFECDEKGRTACNWRSASARSVNARMRAKACAPEICGKAGA